LDPVLLYDGECGFCNSIVRFVLDHEREHTLRFAALQSPFAARILADRPDLQGGDSIVWIELDESRSPAGILVRSAAALRLSRYLGGGWRLLSAAWIVPRPVRDWVYDVVAARRHRIGRKENCLVPTKETRQRFLDDDRSC
jgi:predicted DCC family thiol-disulfide oxidoreductase YuxK